MQNACMTPERFIALWQHNPLTGASECNLPVITAIVTTKGSTEDNHAREPAQITNGGRVGFLKRAHERLR